MEFQPGTSLGPYKIQHAIGSGAMGTVYLAHDSRLDRRVALKTLTEAAGAEAERRLQKEARAIARLNNPNIAGLYDVIEHDGVTVLVMEYVDGQPLSALVREGPLNVERTLAIAVQLTSALAYAHREGIIHRDIKPANVMLTRKGEVKLLDLGIARMATSDPEASTLADTSTVADATIAAGTPAYMAPERLRGHPADARTDIYSVGVLLFELLTGQRPFSETDALALATAHGAPVPHVRDLVRSVPKAVDEIVAKAMAKSPNARFATAEELRNALVRVPEIAGPRPSSGSRRWRSSARVAAVIVAALLGIWLWSKLTGPPAVATLAVPPVTVASAGDPELTELASLLQSVLTRSLTALPGVTVVSGVPENGSSAGSHESQRPEFTASIAIRRALSGVAAEATLARNGQTSAEPHPYTGDELELLRSTVQGLQTTLARYRRVDPQDPKWARAIPGLPATNPVLVSYLRGRTFLDASDDSRTDEKAVSEFQDAIKGDSSFAYAHAGLSQAYSSLFKHTSLDNWLDQARNSATQALLIDPDCDQALVASALVLRAIKQRDSALGQASHAVGLTPDSDDARRMLGVALIDVNQQDRGFEELRRAIVLRPLHGVNYYTLGTQLLMDHRFADAIDPLVKAKELMPKFESAYVNLGYAYQNVRNWSLAIGNYQLALNLSPNDESAFTNLATAFYWNHQFKEALAAFHQAATRDPSNPKRFMNLGDAYDALNQKQNARAAYLKAVDLADARKAVKFDAAQEAIAAKCEAKLGNYDRALSRALAALADDSANPDVLAKLAVVYALKGDTTKALDTLEKALNGRFPWVSVRDDPDFSTLADLPRFKALITAAGG